MTRRQSLTRPSLALTLAGTLALAPASLLAQAPARRRRRRPARAARRSGLGDEKQRAGENLARGAGGLSPEGAGRA
jgi:hypothetical protein